MPLTTIRWSSLPTRLFYIVSKVASVFCGRNVIAHLFGNVKIGPAPFCGRTLQCTTC